VEERRITILPFFSLGGDGRGRKEGNCFDPEGGERIKVPPMSVSISFSLLLKKKRNRPIASRRERNHCFTAGKKRGQLA